MNNIRRDRINRLITPVGALADVFHPLISVKFPSSSPIFSPMPRLSPATLPMCNNIISNSSISGFFRCEKETEKKPRQLKDCATCRVSQKLSSFPNNETKNARPYDVRVLFSFRFVALNGGRREYNVYYVRGNCTCEIQSIKVGAIHRSCCFI